jgi:hypothetical protein
MVLKYFRRSGGRCKKDLLIEVTCTNMGRMGPIVPIQQQKLIR